MATAKVKTEIKSVKLTLSRDEAQALIDVLGSVSGIPKESRRGLTDAIWDALTAAGIRSDFEDNADPKFDLRGDLTFVRFGYSA